MNKQQSVYILVFRMPSRVESSYTWHFFLLKISGGSPKSIQVIHLVAMLVPMPGRTPKPRRLQGFRFVEREVPSPGKKHFKASGKAL